MTKYMTEIYDNNGETLDRYTVIIGNHVYGMSSKPNHPQRGVNQYNCSTNQLDRSELGEKKALQDVPQDVQEAIKARQDTYEQN